jgi:hypothetical protein
MRRPGAQALASRSNASSSVASSVANRSCCSAMLDADDRMRSLASTAASRIQSSSGRMRLGRAYETLCASFGIADGERKLILHVSW